MWHIDEEEIRQHRVDQLWEEHEILLKHLEHLTNWGVPCGPTLEMIK